ncbi:unnamed protein product (macronuclear) [Paramecium tetraurelia]|uniref:Amino acid transporter transmembrane domain-containing protein n=1 Tax=Paramecium tetraurelia TaxID=5888 RepID=A0CVL8_PARTE|nr:uncharacterized protein GSPATT00011003001 [Paramecium tetraurelia]CAK74835.1 unnamed protein product [Paramecium tetraurelia]|eukprot:XP_001442232.1 hypothetical protein (macronuclear) [Paramecium tetraurelia strain d4-2]
MINQSEYQDKSSKPHKQHESTRAMSKLSFAQEGQKQSSLSTIFGITNSMVGSLCLVIPQVFQQCGIITCLIVMIILSLVQYKTCQIMIIHQKEEELDSEHMIKRLLGKSWTQAFRVTSGTLLFIVGIIYFQLINLTLYPILVLIFEKSNYTNYAMPSDGITFDKFSIQWQAIIIFLPLASMLLLKDITKIIKFAHYGVVAIICYCIFIIYIFSANMININEFKGDITWFTWNFIQPAGQFAFGFMVHNSVGQLIKNNANKANNSRDLLISYGIAAIIYGIIGTFGAIGIMGKTAVNPSTILDFFSSTDYAVLFIEGLFLVHLVAAFPIFPYISIYQILETFYHKEYPQKFQWGLKGVFICSCLIVQLFNINVGIVISFDGAVCGFLLVYIIPVYMHFKCYYGNRTNVGDALLDHDSNCVKHKNINYLSLPLRVIIYLIILCVGIFNMIIFFYDFFK